VVVVVLKEVSGLVHLRVSGGAHLSHPMVIGLMVDGQEHLEVLHPWQRGDRGLKHRLAADLDIVTVHAELHIGGQVDVVEHRVPLVSGGGALAGECCGRALLGGVLFLRLHVAVIIIQRPGFVQVFLCVGKEIHGV